jgi:RNA polymerase sigma factor (TIGR02999 family)
VSQSHPQEQTVTRLLQELKSGDRRAFTELLPLVYDELHELAHRQRRRWDGNETLNTTAIIHEAYLRLAGHSAPQWSSHPHFLAVAATAMRQVLLDYAKRQRAAKRDGRGRPVSLDEVEATLREGGVVSEARSEAIIAVEESLRRLEQHDPVQGCVVECRFYGGMTIEETAKTLGVSPATVKRRWAMAQAWLYRDLKRAREGTA